jgi:hypothetical protein
MNYHPTVYDLLERIEQKEERAVPGAYGLKKSFILKGGFKDALAVAVDEKLITEHHRHTVGVVAIEGMAGPPLPSDPVRVYLTAKGRRVLAERRMGASGQEAEVNWDDYREDKRPDGRLLTVKVCEDFGLLGPFLHKAANKDPSIRRKNPAGPGHVYRWDFVRDESDRRAQRQSKREEKPS